MAAGDKYVGCDNPSISWQELLNSILIKDATNNVTGIRVYNHAFNPAQVELVQNCGIPALNLEEVLRNSIVLDADGQPALCLMESTT